LRRMQTSPLSPYSSQSTGAVREITADQEFYSAITSPQLTVVDFFAVWCGPCKTIAPRIELLATQFTGRVNFRKVDVDKLKTLAQSQGIAAMPTFIFYRNGQRLGDLRGANESELVRLLHSFV